VKTISGLPVKPEPCPSRQPLIPERTRRERNFLSVDFDPRDLLRLMMRERVTASNISKGPPPAKRILSTTQDEEAEQLFILRHYQLP